MTDLKKLRDDVTEAYRLRSRSLHAANKLARAIFFALAAAIAGAAQFISWGPGESPTSAQVVGICATFVVFVAAAINIVSDKDASSELALAQTAITKAQEAEDELRSITLQWPDIDRIIALYQATKIMRDAIEQASIAMVGDQVKLVHTMMQLVGPTMVVAAGFANNDQWTICIYRAVPQADNCRFDLELIAHHRSIDCELATARRWPEGRGVAGVAFSNSQEILVEDLAADGIRAIFQPANLIRTYDDDRYRSMVAVPIRVAGEARPWGIVTATNDRIEHFNHSQTPGLKPEEAIRALANYTALAVATVTSRDRARSASPTVI